MQVSKISCTWELSLPQQIMETLKYQSGILWVHQLCILILIFPNSMGSTEGGKYALCNHFFNSKSFKTRYRVTFLQCLQTRRKYIIFSWIQDEDLLLWMSLIYWWLIYVERENIILSIILLFVVVGLNIRFLTLNCTPIKDKQVAAREL